MHTKHVTIRKVLPVLSVMEGEGFKVNRPFPKMGLSHLDPFLLLDELGPMHFKAGEAKGTPPHPHKGFEILSYILKGGVNHTDSLGNRATLDEGDVQWMTSGKGIVHKEQPLERIKREGGELHGFQIWINLPAAQKEIEPAYQEIRSAEIPTYTGDGFSVKVLIGSAFNITSPIQTHTPVEYHHYTLDGGASVAFPVRAEQTSFLYPVSGAFRVGNEVFRRGSMPVLSNDGDTLFVQNDSVTEPAEFLFLSGKPLGEPVARYGPFVMNTAAELEQAFMDYQLGLMGELE